MGNFFITILIIAVLVGCSKSSTNDNANCDSHMIDKFKGEIACTDLATDGPCSYLAKGDYMGEKIYFINIVCAFCNTLPPQEGYNCRNRKVAIVDFNKNVTNIEVVQPKRKDQQ